MVAIGSDQPAPDDYALPHDYALLETCSRLSIGLRALLKARVRCLSLDDILCRFEATPVISYEQRELLFLRLRDLEWTSQDFDRLRNVLNRLEDEGELSKSRPGARITGLIKEILQLLPNDERVERCMRYLSHRHTHRRTMACKLLRDSELRECEANAVCELAGRRPEWPILRLAAFQARAASVEHLLTHVLPRFSDPYWESRVIEAVIDRTPDETISRLASQFPLAFLWAIARRGDKHLLVLATPHIADISWNWLSVVAWALGRLAADSELDALECRLRESDVWAKYLELTGGAAPYFLQSPSSQWPRWDLLVQQGSRHALGAY